MDSTTATCQPSRLDYIHQWPGPPDLLPHYSAGWDAYSRHYLACCDVGRSSYADPEQHAPAVLHGVARAAWCTGWLEAGLANNAVNVARVAGIIDDVDLWRVACAEMDAIRASYLPGQRHQPVH